MEFLDVPIDDVERNLMATVGFEGATKNSHCDANELVSGLDSQGSAAPRLPLDHVVDPVDEIAREVDGLVATTRHGLRSSGSCSPRSSARVDAMIVARPLRSMRRRPLAWSAWIRRRRLPL